MTTSAPRPAGAILALVALTALAGCASHTPLPECAPDDDTTPICGFQNPEDLVGLDDGWMLISQMVLADEPGSLVAFRPTDGARSVVWPTDETALVGAGNASCAPPSLDDFAPHGIELSRDRRTLLVVNHGGRESIERFAIGEQDGVPTLTWTDCILFEQNVMLNDVASLPGGDFVVTQMVSQSLFSPLALVLGLDTGRVWHWSRSTGIRAIPDSEGNGPNGIVTSQDGETLYFSEWGAQQLVRLGLDGGSRQTAPLGFHPDNLSWTADGRVLVGGQIAGPIEATGCFELLEGGCSLPSAVSTVDPETLAVRRVWTHDPATAVGGVSAALERDDVIWLGAFGGDRIGWIPWNLPGPAGDPQ
ncbi:MAG: hypothetical protein NXI30_19850 [bacterium]|nr:hypothetical protein [bacterium]